jgi:glycosyltransferase involved in cell wall biosynthesis
MRYSERNDPKRIMILSSLDVWSLGQNTGAQSLWKTLEGYAKYGWDVVFITGNKNSQSGFDDNEKLIKSGIKIDRFDLRALKKLFKIKIIGFFARSVWWIYFQIQSVLRGVSMAKKEKVDVFYGYEVDGVVAAKILSLIFRKPMVSRFQGTRLSQYLDGGNRFWKLRYWWHILALKTKTDLLVMTNDGTRGDVVLRNLNADMSKVKFWINGTDESLMGYKTDTKNLRKSLGILPDDKIMLSVSRLERWKRIDRTLRALPLILREFPKIKYLIIGEGSERESLENIVKKLGISRVVVFGGGVPRGNLVGYYNLADIFVSMYDISNVGNPLIEAMSFGKCVVTYDVGGTNRFVIDGENGILVKDPSPKKLAELLIELLNSEEKRRTLGKMAKQFAEKNFWSWGDRINTEIEEVKKLLG